MVTSPISDTVYPRAPSLERFFCWPISLESMRWSVPRFPGIDRVSAWQNAPAPLGQGGKAPQLSRSRSMAANCSATS